MNLVHDIFDKAMARADNNNEDKGKIEQLKTLAAEVKESFESGESREEGIKNVIAKFSDADKEAINKQMDGAKDYIKKIRSDSMEDDSYKEQLQEIFKNPKVLLSNFSGGDQQFNKEGIIKLLAENTDLEKQQLENYAEKISDFIATLKSKFDSDNEEGFAAQIEDKIAQFFNSTNKPELQYSVLKWDLTKAINNPNDSLDIVKQRLSKLDSDSLKAILVSNTSVKDEDIDNVIQSIEDTKQQLISKVDEVEHKIKQEVETLKKKAIIESENARKVALSAVWWLVISTVLSGGAAILGSLLLFI